MKSIAKTTPPPGVGLRCEDPTLAQQHFAEECDINTILERYTSTGLLPERNGAFYADFSDVHDYRSSLESIREAEESFLTLPAKTRQLFNNDPGELIHFMSNPDNKSRLAEFGLAAEPASSLLDVTGRTDTVSPQTSNMESE